MAAPPPPSPGGGWAEWLDLLRNRLILSGLATIVVLLLVAIVFVVIDSGDDAPSVIDGARPTPTAGGTPLPGDGVTGVVRTTAGARNGPGTSYSVIGTVPRGTSLQVVGRNADDTWVQVVYPPGSQLRVWINLAFIDVRGDISDLAIAGPGDSPNVAVPTSVGPIGSPTPEVDVTLQPEPTGTPTRRPTSTRVPTITPQSIVTPTPVIPFP
jgi:uncharacterized protein YraI